MLFVTLNPYVINSMTVCILFTSLALRSMDSIPASTSRELFDNVDCLLDWAGTLFSRIVMSRFWRNRFSRASVFALLCMVGPG